MHPKAHMALTRRDFGKIALSTVPAAMFAAGPNSKIKGVQIGAITYSFRQGVPKAEIIPALVKIGLSEVELMSGDCEALAGAPAAPAFEYVPVTLHAGVAYVSGQLPKEDGEVRICGKVGGDVDIETARRAARICILQGLSCLKAEIGSLDRVERVLKVTGFVASASGFSQQPKVIDAASSLLVDLLGDAGRHARSAVGVAELPRNSMGKVQKKALRADYADAFTS